MISADIQVAMKAQAGVWSTIRKILAASGEHYDVLSPCISMIDGGLANAAAQMQAQSQANVERGVKEQLLADLLVKQEAADKEAAGGDSEKTNGSAKPADTGSSESSQKSDKGKSKDGSNPPKGSA